MNTIARIKMLKAMEFIARNINEETILNRWLSLGIADGDIEYGDLSVGLDNADKLKYYMEGRGFCRHDAQLPVVHGSRMEERGVVL